MNRATFLILLLLAPAALAQEVLDMRPKHSAPIDGTLSVLKSQSKTGFGLDLGGTLVKDRVWFFASAEKAPLRTFDTNAVASIGERQNLKAVFASQTTPVTQTLAVPSNFLSLHYTAVVSPNSFFTMSVSETRH